MKNIILTNVYGIDPQGRGKVQAVKAVRSATGLSLREAFDITNAVRNGHAHEVAVTNESYLRELGGSFDWTDAEAQREGIDPNEVRIFILDALSTVAPESAARILALPSYKRIAEALR